MQQKRKDAFTPLGLTAPITQEALLPYRAIGDPLADETIASIFNSGPQGLAHVRRLLTNLVQNDHPLLDDPARDEERLPPELMVHVRDYFRKSDEALRGFDREKVKLGERIFQDHGPEILLLLATYSLPASYTAKRGAQVLAQTGRLESHPFRRLIETTQMVIDVMAPDGLSVADSAENHGKGIRAAQKVRLMHAAIRRLILTRDGEEWIRNYGVPINQMDLCGTLMTFSSVILDGLKKLKVTLSKDEQEAYLYAWCAVGTVMGVRPELIPQDLGRANTFKDVIRSSEIGSSPQGIALTQALVDAFSSRIEPVFFAWTARRAHEEIFRGVRGRPRPAQSELHLSSRFVSDFLHRASGPFTSRIENVRLAASKAVNRSHRHLLVPGARG